MEKLLSFWKWTKNSNEGMAPREKTWEVINSGRKDGEVKRDEWKEWKGDRSKKWRDRMVGGMICMWKDMRHADLVSVIKYKRGRRREGDISRGGSGRINEWHQMREWWDGDINDIEEYGEIWTKSKINRERKEPFTGVQLKRERERDTKRETNGRDE